MRDLGFAAPCFRDARPGAPRWLSAGGEAAPGRDGARQRPARPRADALGRGRPPPRRLDRRRLRAASPACAGASTRRARRARRGPARPRRSPSSRSSSAALPEARLPFQDAARGRRDGRRLRRPAPRCASARAAPRPARRRSRRCRSCPRSSRCAAAMSPPTTASSTRRSPPTSTATRTRATPPRSTTAAARTSWPRCSPPTWRARRSCAGSVERPAKLAASRSRSASAGAAVEVFAWSERHARHRRGARPAPPRPRAAARGRDARADGGPARRRAGRAGGDPARRGRGLTQDPVHPAQFGSPIARALPDRLAMHGRHRPDPRPHRLRARAAVRHGLGRRARAPSSWARSSTCSGAR